MNLTKPAFVPPLEFGRGDLHGLLHHQGNLVASTHGGCEAQVSRVSNPKHILALDELRELPLRLNG